MRACPCLLFAAELPSAFCQVSVIAATPPLQHDFAAVWLCNVARCVLRIAERGQSCAPRIRDGRRGPDEFA